MKEKLKELTNKELIDLYRLILSHQEYLKNEIDKLEKDEVK